MVQLSLHFKFMVCRQSEVISRGGGGLGAFLEEMSKYGSDFRGTVGFSLRMRLYWDLIRKEGHKEV